MEKSEYCEKINSYITDYIKFGDAKAGSILAFTSAIGGSLISQVDKYYVKAHTISACFSSMLLLSFILCLFFCLLVAWHCLRSLSPRTSTAESLNSFPDIVKRTAGEYVKDIESVTTEESIAIQYSKHNWTLAHIASKKFSAISTAISFLRLVLITMTIFVLLAVIINIAGA